jgi:hypothetical protein
MKNAFKGLSNQNDFAVPRTPPSILRRRSNTNRKNQKNLDYIDVLQCKSPIFTLPDEMAFNDDSEDLHGSEANFDSLFNFDDAVKVDYTGTFEGNRKLTHSPVVYQFYGRSRARGSQPSDSIHFILLGPNVDHWKVTGQLLASRGFNAIACERLDGTETGQGVDRSQDAPNLVLEILEVLKWNRVVLVGCDKESILALETAMMLAPDRVAGLILCGDLAEADDLSSQSGMGAVDSFLKRILECPYLIVWDGDSPTLISGSSPHEALKTSSESSDRCLILGGGLAPHRTKPEQFSWILTRFVEEKLEVPQKKAKISGWNERAKDTRSNLLRAINLPFGVDSVVSPEGRLLLGRAVAAALFYITIMKVAIVQYGVLRAGLLGIKTRYDSVATLRRKLFQTVTAFFVNYGYIPRLFKVKNYNEYSKGDNTLEASPDMEGDEKYESAEVDDKDSSSNDNESRDDEEREESEDNTDESERLRMKPFFFLDHIVT